MHTVPFSAEPGFVEGMGSVGRGPVCSVACGREFTVLATLPYEGPDAAEMRKLKQTEDVKRLAAERAEKQAKREAEAEAARREEERLALIKDLNRGHLLCTADDKCPGFFPDEISPFTCGECGRPLSTPFAPRTKPPCPFFATHPPHAAMVANACHCSGLPPQEDGSHHP